MARKIFMSLAFFLSVAIACFAQIPSPLIFNRITKKDGLASAMSFYTVRDKQGYLWIATQNGLQRYDGHRFLTFRHIPGDSLTIAENSINKIFIDKKERLWLLFDNKVGVFNTTQFSFIEIKVAVPVMMIRKIMEDDQGKLLLFADSKQFIYDEAKHVFSSKYPFPALPAGMTTNDMVIDPSSGNYWCTGKQGSLLFDPKTKQFNTNTDSIFKIKNAKYPFIAKDGSYWMISWIPFTAAAPVLYSYNRQQNKLTAFEKIRAYKADSYYEIWNVFEQSNGTIWAYGMGLLAYYDTNEKCFININSDPFRQNGIDYDLVSNVYEDKENNVWVCTNKGLYRFNVNAQVFQNISNKRAGDTITKPFAVSTVVQTKNNGIWVATWGGGIFSYDNQLHPVANPLTMQKPEYRGLHASDMTQRRNGEIWIGLQSGELIIYDPATNKTSVLFLSLLKNEIVQQLLEDHEGNMWIGSNSGLLLKCDHGNWQDTVRAFTKIISDAGDIFRLYEDNKGQLWVCTASTGVYLIDRKNGNIIKQFTETGGKNDGLLDNGASDVLQYDDSTYIIAGDGLCILNSRTNKFRYLTAADGLPSEHITSVTLDKQKRIWVACDGGLYRLNIDKKLAVSYGAADGIINNIFQVSSGTILQDGRITVGTPHDFLVFDPEKAINRNEVPPVNITGFALEGRYLSVDSLKKIDKIILPYDNTFINVELSTLSFREQYYMYYMLEGRDKTWKRVYNNQVTYQFLPPGNYTLKLKSENGDGVESKSLTTIHIHVDPPFWKTWWFYCLLALFIGGLLFWLDHRRMKRREAILKMRSDIADGLHQEINAALGNITILSEMAKMKADDEPGKSKEFIEQIHAKSHNMTIAMDDILWSIDPSNDSMENFILRFKEYIDALKNRHKVQIDLLVDKNVEKLNLKMKVRNDVFWLFKGGISNTVKTGATNNRIHIAYEKPNLIYTLEFDTATVNIELLNNLRHRKELSDKLEDVGAKLDFKEHKANAVFVLTIPLKTNGI